MGFLVPIMAFVIGASFFGADQKTGMIEHLLTWEPRRSRFLSGRLIGGAITTFVITTLLSGFLVVVIYVLSSATGGAEGAFGIWPTVLGAVVRSGAVGAIFFMFGFGATVITNNSVASIVGFLIYVFVIETALVQPFLPDLAVWLPMNNADAFVSRSGVGEGTFFGGGFGADLHHGWVSAGLLAAAWGAATFLISMAVFNRRDID